MKKSALLVLALMVLAVPVFAGTATNTGLESLFNEVSNWLEGAPGKIMAVAFIILGRWCSLQRDESDSDICTTKDSCNAKASMRWRRSACK